MNIRTCSASGPGDNDDSGHVHLGAEVDHPDGLFHVEVVEHRAAGQCRRRGAGGGAGGGVGVAGGAGVRMRPVGASAAVMDVTLALSSVVDP